MLRKLSFVLLFVLLAVAVVWVAPISGATPASDCEAFDTGTGMVPLTSFNFNFNCTSAATAYFGVCDSGAIPNDDLFTITYNGSLVASNYYSGGNEYVVIGSAQTGVGTNVATLTSTNVGILDATWSYAVSTDVVAVESFLGAFCGTDFAGRGTLGACDRLVPVFTMDAAPSNGTLEFRVLFGEMNRNEGITLRTWNITQGQQINNDVVIVPAPQWARVWWQPEGEDEWYLLTSQYWHGDGTTASEYGVDCKSSDVPSYHTSFSSAIPASEVPEFHP